MNNTNPQLNYKIGNQKVHHYPSTQANTITHSDNFTVNMQKPGAMTGKVT